MQISHLGLSLRYTTYISCTACLTLIFLIANLAQADPSNQSISLSSPTSPTASPQVVSTPVYRPTKAHLQEAARASYPNTHYQRALYLRQKGLINQALVEFLKATQENPRLLEAFYEQALIFRERGYLKLAESALEQALAVKPDYQKARILLATLRLEQGNIASAVDELTQSLGVPKPRLPKTTQAATLDNNIKTAEAPFQETFLPPSVMQTPHNRLDHAPALMPGRIEGRNDFHNQAAHEMPPGHTHDKAKMSWLGWLRPLKFFRKEPSPTKQDGSKVEIPLKPVALPKVEQKRQRWFMSFLGSVKRKSAKDTQPIAMVVHTRSNTTDTGKRVPHTFSQQLSSKDQTPEIRTPISTLTLSTGTTVKPVGLTYQAEPPSLVPQPPIKHSLKELPKPGTTPSGLQTFVAPALPSSETRLLSAAQPPVHKPADLAVALSKQSSRTPQSDPWVDRLRYLAENGTATLKEGEAFLFSEQTGDAVLFRPEAEPITRKIAPAKDPTEVLSTRRPDIAFPQELQYNLSLLGKLLPRQATAAAKPISNSGFTLNEMLETKESFWGWLRRLLKI
ncbi:MAG: tetratricopeptide repeat protein [Candidatus Melainabacteria bacterium]|nr:tetratricopeptide repeat protein [Candidatus Melainabacteria bacterium]